MPIYLVRWPNLSAALVKAGSEDELLDILDEVANAEGCTWSVYRGPLFLDFSVPVKVDIKRPESPGPLRQNDIEVGDVSRLAEGTHLEVEIPACDTGFDMAEAIQKKAFPHLFKALHEGGLDVTEEELREALTAELQTLVKASWRTEQVKRRDDPASAIAAMMGAPPRLVQRWIEAAQQKPPSPAPKKKRKR